MAFSEWSPKYSVSVQRFDAEHKKLFSLLNQLNEAMQQGQVRLRIVGVLQELNAYTRNHFQAEENAMRCAGYAGLKQHLVEHRALTEKTNQYIAEYDATHSSSIAIELLFFLRKWWEDHVLRCDQQYAEALNSAGIK